MLTLTFTMPVLFMKLHRNQLKPVIFTINILLDINLKETTLIFMKMLNCFHFIILEHSVEVKNAK